MRVAAVLSLIILCCAGTSCRRSLFDEKLPRHQYEDYDTARQGVVPAEETDEFGHKRPNLRQRLSGE